MTYELLPCPFCGHDDLAEKSDAHSIGRDSVMECLSCGATASAKRWNTRYVFAVTCDTFPNAYRVATKTSSN